MPRTRSTTSGTTKQRVTYSGLDSPSDESADEDILGLGMIAAIMGFAARRTPARKKRTTTKKRAKRAQPADNCENHCQCCHCKKSAPKKKRNAPKPQNRGKNTETVTAKTLTCSGQDSAIALESDDEIPVEVPENQEVNIKTKVDNFFKALESDDEELEDKLKTEKSSYTIPPEKKPKDFYTILSDSEDENEKDKLEITVSDVPEVNKNPNTEPSTSGIGNTLTNGLKMATNTLSFINEKKTEDLFAFVDDILNECNITVDLTDDKLKENIPVSLDDLKKKTDEILGGVASLIDDFKPKEPEKKPLKSPVKEVPSCPICLEQLGGSRQAMSTLCGHMFCEPCILKVFQNTKQCPSCRKTLTKKGLPKYHPVYI